MKQDKNQLLADPPITSKSEDRLGRAPLAEKIATMINKFDGQDSFVIGIEGVWGSGKTSFIELVLESLGTQNKEKWKIVRFNPWVFFNVEALYLDFFAELGKVTGNKDILNYGKRILRKVEIEPQVSIPFLNFSLGKLKADDRSLKEIRDEIERQFVKSGNKMIVVIDDIDRLDKEDVREIFKMVKVNANFPNTIYLLAYDRTKVENILTKDNFPGSEYLKKIVQVSFALPKPEPNQIYEVLGEKLDNLLDSDELKNIIKTYWDTKRWGNIFVGGFRDVFKTIRDVKRFISSWLLDYLIVGYNEVNPIDFLGVELIRVFAPDVYTEISGAKELFTKLDSNYVGARDDRPQRLEDIKKILEKSPQEIKTNITEVCRQLFPQVDGLFTNTHYSYDWAVGWRQSIRVCSEDHFDTYFLLSVPTGKIAQSDLNFYANSLNKKGQLFKQLKLVSPEVKLKTTLDYLMDKLDSFNQTNLTRFIEELFLFGDTVNVEPSPAFESVPHKIRRLCYHAIKRLGEKRGSVIKIVYKKTPAVYTSTFFVGYLISEYEDYVNKKETDTPLIDKESDIQILRNLAVSKIREKLKKDKNLPEKHLAAFLLWLNMFGHNDEVKKYINSMLTSNTRTIEILSAFKTAYFSTGFGDYVSTKHDKIDTKSLEVLVGLPAIDSAVERVVTGNLSVKEKSIITLYQESKKKGDF